MLNILSDGKVITQNHILSQACSISSGGSGKAMCVIRKDYPLGWVVIDLDLLPPHSIELL